MAVPSPSSEQPTARTQRLAASDDLSNIFAAECGEVQGSDWGAVYVGRRSWRAPLLHR
ncbi:hypothetical protein ACP70R_000440 [Stipagrostis hirtigluma subsp. patula]